MPDGDHHDRSASFGGLRRVPSLAEGYAAIDRADREVAKAFFLDAVAKERTAETLEGLGMAAWLAPDEALLFEAREGAYELFRQRGDRLGAGRVAVWLASDSLNFRGEASVANGWLRRAHRFLDGLDPAPEHGWLALVEAEIRLMLDNDSEASAARAAEAVAIARRVGDTEVEMYALAIEGLTLVTTGIVQEGMSRLDEAAAACLAGEVRQPWVVSSVLCCMMDACDRVRDWDRAREWFRHVGSFATRWNAREFYAWCRPHYAVVLTWRGDWEEAENELQLSIDDMMTIRPPMAVEGIVRLAELRWRQGRIAEAAALFEQVRHEPLAQLGRAALALDRGESAIALELVERCLRRLPGKDRLERLPALELYIRVCIAMGSCERAREVLPELEEIAKAVATKPARASAHVTMGLIAAAEGQLDAARMHLEDAVDLFEESRAPFEAGRARLELAGVLLALERSSEAAGQGQIALAEFQRLGALGQVERAQRLILAASSGSGSGRSDAPAPPIAGLSGREVEVLQLLARGLSNQEIADRLVLSIRTVQRHIENIYTKTGARGRAAAAVFATVHSIVTPDDRQG